MPVVARVIAAQLRQAAELHQEYLTLQAQAHAQYLASCRRVLTRRAP
jgi:hypothetical protein